MSERYGKEWEKEMMKLRKKDLVGMVKNMALGKIPVKGYKPHMCIVCETRPSAVITLDKRRICLKCWKNENEEV